MPLNFLEKELSSSHQLQPVQCTLLQWTAVYRGTSDADQWMKRLVFNDTWGAAIGRWVLGKDDDDWGDGAKWFLSQVYINNLHLGWRGAFAVEAGGRGCRLMSKQFWTNCSSTCSCSCCCINLFHPKRTISTSWAVAHLHLLYTSNPFRI